MNILTYTDAHEAFRQRVRNFFKAEVAPHAEIWEKKGIVPREIWRRMGEEGFLCLDVPKAYGGPGLDFLYALIVIDELVRTCHFGLLAPLHSDVVVPYITAFASEDLKKKYLPGCVKGEIITALAMTEPGAGSDLTSIATTAKEDGDEVILNGQKTFISCGINCGLVILAARDPAVEDPYASLDLYLVEESAPGFEKGNCLNKMGWHSQDTAELFFNDCRVPLSNRLGMKGSGFMMLMNKLQQERLVCAVSAQTAAECALEMTIDYCRKNTLGGRPLVRFQENQHRIVDMTTEVKLGRTFVDKLVAEHMEGKAVVAEVSMAKAWITEMAVRVADGCMDLYGPNGNLEEMLIGRFWRDLRVMAIFAGTNEIMRNIAAKFMGL